MIKVQSLFMSSIEREGEGERAEGVAVELKATEGIYMGEDWG